MSLQLQKRIMLNISIEVSWRLQEWTTTGYTCSSSYGNDWLVI